MSADHQVITELRSFLENNHVLQAFEEAIASIQKPPYGPVEELSSITDIESYISYLKTFLEWIPCEDVTGFHVYQFLCGFYYILDQPSLKPLQSSVTVTTDNPQVTPLSQWMVKFAQAMGSHLSEVGTVTPASLASFENTPAVTYGDPSDKAKNPPKPGYCLNNYQTPPGGWTSVSFNDFFTRQFTDIDTQRAIGQPTDDSWICNGADSSFDGNWPIASDNTVTFPWKHPNKHTVTAKGLTWDIAELLADSQYASHFAGGQFMHSFLSPADYHRLHAPVSGEILEAQVIPGNVYLQVKPHTGKHGAITLKPQRNYEVDETDEGEISILKAPDHPGYQFSQARGLIIIKNPTVGLVAFLPIGMAQVSSVVLAEGVTVGAQVTKGQELAHFLFGGSDYIMCFQAQAQVDFSELVKNKWYPVRSAFVQAKGTAA